MELLEAARPPIRGPLPSIEATGLARGFIRRAGQEYAATRSMGVLLDRINERTSRHPLRQLRPELLAGFEREYRQQPSQFQLHLEFTRRKSGLTVFEMRLLSCSISDPLWEDEDRYEPNLSITNILLDINRKHYGKSDYTILTSHIVSLHALARRYERCSDRSDQSVIADLRDLLKEQPLDQDRQPCEIATVRGSWRGQHRKFNDYRGERQINIIAMRTFIAHEME